MYKVIYKPYNGSNYLTFTGKSSYNSHYINVYISETDQQEIFVSIAKSEDGFNFKDAKGEVNDLKLIDNMSFNETFDFIKKYLTDKGYKFSDIY